jgi:hypothetical protein
MGMQDRDWYKDLQKEKERGSKPKERSLQDLFQKPTYRSHSRPMHWMLIALFWTFIIILLTAAFRFLR